MKHFAPFQTDRVGELCAPAKGPALAKILFIMHEIIVCKIGVISIKL